MRPLKLLALMSIVLFMFSAHCLAKATYFNNSSASLQLENSGLSARSLSMGSAFTGVADDASTLFWNPAGLGTLKSWSVGLHHNSWLVGTLQESMLLNVPFGALGGLGTSFNYVDYGSFEGRDSTGALSGSYTARLMGLSAGWGSEIIPGMSGGVAMKGTQQTLADTSYNSVALDAGLLWLPAKIVRLGFAYNNLGIASNGNARASALRFGSSLGLEVLGKSHLIVASNISYEPQGLSRINFGGELTAFSEVSAISAFSFRSGYQLNLGETALQGLYGLTLGAGFMTGKNLQFDYAYVPFGDLGESHRLSLNYIFSMDQEKSAGPGMSKTSGQVKETLEEQLQRVIDMEKQGQITKEKADQIKSTIIKEYKP